MSAQGKRETVTIPAGEIGNERPIEIVTETWFSPELHTMVLRKHSDPRHGRQHLSVNGHQAQRAGCSIFKPPAGAKVSIEPMLELHKEIAPKE